MKRFLFGFFFIIISLNAFTQTCTLKVSAAASNNTICTGSTVTITAQTSGGTAPLTYSWSTGETTQTITVAAAGTYSVTVTDNTGSCTATASTIINRPDFLKVADVFICQNSPAIITASGADSYQWYDAPGGNLVSSQATFTTPVLNSTTTYYLVGTKSGCSTEPTPVRVNVVPIPGAPTARSVSICSGSTVTLSASSAEGTIFDWFATPTGGNSLITSPDYTTPTLTATTTYYVQVSNGTCPGPRMAVTVTVNPVPITPQATGASVCFNSTATLTATATTGTIKWYDSSFSNTPLTTGATFTTPVLTTSTTFYVEAGDDQTGCTSRRIPVVALVMTQVPHPTAPGTIVCSGNPATLTASSTQPGTTFQWYDAANAGNLVFTGATYTTPPLTAATIYYVQGNYQGCTGPRTAVTIDVTNTTPTAPTVTGNTTVCQGTSATLTTDGAAASYQWYDAPTGGNLLPSNGNTFTTPALNTSITYYVQAANGQCTSSRTSVTVNVNPAANAPTAGPVPATICPGGTATLTAAGSNITWFDAAGNAVATGNSFTTPALSATTTYYAQSSNGQCSSASTPITVTVTSVPAFVFAYLSGTFCLANGGTARPVINSTIAGTYHFTVSPAAGLILNPNTGVITIAGSLPGSYDITLTTTSNNCISATVNVSISAGAGSAQFNYPSPTYCQYDTNPSPTFGNGAYAGRFTASPAGLVFVDNNTGQIDLTNSQPGAYTITNRLLCANTTATQVITINPRTSVNAGPDQNLVAGTVAQLAGSQTGPGGVTWSGGAGQFTDRTSPVSRYIPAVGETSATLTFTAADPGNGCTPISDQVVITYSPAVVTAPGATICAGTTATLTATGSPNGDYQWYATASGGSRLSTNPTFITPVLTVTTTYYVGSASSARTPVIVTVTGNPVPTVTGNTICFDQQAVLNASVSGAPTGTIFQWFDNNGTLLATGVNYTTTYLQQDTRYFVRYIDPAANCPNVLTPVNVTVNPLPNITSGLTASTCSDVPFSYSISATSTASGPINFTWSRAADTENPAGAGNTSDINETLKNTTTKPFNVVYNISATSGTSALCASAPFKLVVTVNPALVFTSGGAAEICNGTSSDYQVMLNFTPTSISWSRAAVAGIRNPTITGQTSPVIHEILYNTSNAPVNVTYKYIAKSGDCTASEFDVVVTVNPPVTVSSVPAQTVCGGTQFNYNITSRVAGATFNWTRAPVSGISNAAGNSTSTNMITETLINTTSDPIVVGYQIIPFYKTCRGTPFTYRVTVNPTPATPVITAPDEICTGTTLNFTTTTVDGAIYTWTGPNSFTSTLQNPSIANITPANAGDYTLTTTVNGCVSAVTTKAIAVDVQPIAAAGADQVVCAGFPVQLNGKITGGVTTGVWSTSGTGTFSPSNTALNPLYTPSTADASLTSLTFTLSSTTLANCTIATSSLTATLVPPAIADAGPDQNICNQNTSVTLTGKATNNSSVLWSTTGTGVFSTPANQLTTTYVMSADDLKKGAVSFTLTAANAHCEAADLKIVHFLPPPVVNAGKKLNYIIRNTLFRLSPTVNESGVKYLWSPPTYLDNDTLKNATFKGIEDQTLNLKVTDTLGCVTTDQLSFIVLDPIVTYNTFTPNGDGINDLWVIPSIIKYPGAVVDIYNRYGVPMFHSNGYSIPWDGTYNGQPAPVGVYYYVITTKFSSQVFSGYITVLR